jgi:hypothetical protein
MSAMPSHTQPELSAASLLIKPSAETAAVRPADPKNGQFSNVRRSPRGQAPLAFARYLIAFSFGVTATLAWQSYGDAVRRMVAPVTPPPDQQQFTAISLDLDAVRRSIDGLATGFATSIARSQEEMTRSVDQLAAGLEQTTREIVKLQALEQSVLNKTSEPVPRPAPAPVRNPAPRPALPPVAVTPARNP